MSDFGGNGHYVQCPLCEGKGQMHRSDLVAKLNDPELLETLRTHAGPGADSPQAAGREATAASSGPTPREREVLTAPWNKLLWRRSPKE